MEPSQSTKGDAVLVVEMIKLLSDELQRVQNEIEDLRNSRHPPSTAHAGSSSLANADELYALQEENLRMRSRIEDVKETLDDLRGVQESPSDGEHHDERLIELSEEASKKDAGYMKTKAKLSAKIETVRGKYKEEKAVASKLQESISQVETQITSVEGAHAEGLQRLEDLAAELARQKALVPPFDSLSFLKAHHTGEYKIPHATSFAASGTRLLLPEAVSALCVPGGYIAKHNGEIVWSRHPPRTRCLVLGPTHRYNPKLRNSKGGWEAMEETSRHSEEIELFYRENQAHWCYAGTFRYVGREVRFVKDLGNAVQKDLETIRAKTVLFDYMIPPILMGLLKNMYDSGFLKVACVGWRRTGFNQALAEALFAMPGVRFDQGPSSIIQTPRERSGPQKIPMKRDREEELN